jgi:hypothetical protein
VDAHGEPVRSVTASERRLSTLAFVTLDNRRREAAGKEGFRLEDPPEL